MRIFFLLLLISRSSLDIFTNIGVYITSMNFNIPSLISILIILGGSFYLILKGNICVNRISRVFGIWLLVLIPFVFISIANFGMNGLVAFREWIRLFTIFMIFILSINLANKNSNKSLSLLFLSLPIPLIVAVYQLINHRGLVSKGIHRIYGTFAHPNSLALYLVLFIGLTYWKFKSSQKKFWLFLLLVQLFCLIFTFNIGGYIMFGILSICLLLKEKPNQKIIIFFVFFFFVLLLFNNSQFKVKYTRIKSINITRTIKEKEVVDSFSWRIVNWDNLLTLWRKKPFLGYGLQTTSFINPWKTPEGIGFAPHNDFIRYLVETGIIGLFFYIYFIFYVGYQIFRKYKLCIDPQTKFLLYVLIAVFIAWHIGSISDNFITTTVFQFYFWAVLGIALKKEKREQYHRKH